MHVCVVLLVSKCVIFGQAKDAASISETVNVGVEPRHGYVKLYSENIIFKNIFIAL